MPQGVALPLQGIAPPPLLTRQGEEVTRLLCMASLMRSTNSCGSSPSKQTVMRGSHFSAPLELFDTRKRSSACSYSSMRLSCQTLLPPSSQSPSRLSQRLVHGTPRASALPSATHSWAVRLSNSLLSNSCGPTRGGHVILLKCNTPVHARLPPAVHARAKENAPGGAALKGGSRAHARARARMTGGGTSSGKNGTASPSSASTNPVGVPKLMFCASSSSVMSCATRRGTQ